MSAGSSVRELGAIEDFQAYAESESNHSQKETRMRCIEALQSGKNPFTPEVLKGLDR